jgi:type IV secretion system protein VirB2
MRRVDGAQAQLRKALLLLGLVLQTVSVTVHAQTSPFDTGANSLVDFALTIATPIAILVVIGAAIAAAVGRISWGWVVGGIAGIAAIFGSPQIVAWIRGMFGV